MKGLILVALTLLVVGCSNPATVDKNIKRKLCHEEGVQPEEIELIMLGENSEMRLAAVKGELYFIQWSDANSSIATRQKLSLPPSVLPTPVISTASGNSEVIKTLRLMEQKNLDYQRVLEAKDTQLKKLKSEIETLKVQAKAVEDKEDEKVAQTPVEAPQMVLESPEPPKRVKMPSEPPKTDMDSFASRYKQVESFICE